MKKTISLLLILALLLPCAFASANYEEDAIRDILEQFDNPTYFVAYEAFLKGEVMEKGTSGSPARAVQQILNAFGEKMNVDSKASSSTIKALNKIQTDFGLDVTDRVDLQVYSELLCVLLIYENGEDAMDSVLAAGMSKQQYLYCLARKLVCDEYYYQAKLTYEMSGWKDCQLRAFSCAVSWPKHGRVWRDSELVSEKVLFKIKVTNSDDDVARCFKIYNLSQQLVAVLFIGGNGSAQTGLLPGTYTIKMGTGSDWYGAMDTFGEEGSYCVLDYTSFDIGYIYTWDLDMDVFAYLGLGSDEIEWSEF